MKRIIKAHKIVEGNEYQWVDFTLGDFEWRLWAGTEYIISFRNPTDSQITMQIQELTYFVKFKFWFKRIFGFWKKI